MDVDNNKSNNNTNSLLKSHTLKHQIEEEKLNRDIINSLKNQFHTDQLECKSTFNYNFFV
jgi:hypothetical protein